MRDTKPSHARIDLFNAFKLQIITLTILLNHWNHIVAMRRRPKPVQCIAVVCDLDMDDTGGLQSRINVVTQQLQNVCNKYAWDFSDCEKINQLR